MDDTTSQPAGNTRGISLIGLIALVVSSSIGSGVFALSTDISAAAAPGPALIAWLITGIGFMALATTFGRLSVVRPDLNGIVDYAREGFGPFVGLVSGWGYWLSIWIGNVAFCVMLVTAIVMVCKLVPIFAFILAVVVMFDPAVFTADFWGNLANNLSDPALAAAYMAKAWLAQERGQGASEAPRIRVVDGICAACSAAFLIVAIAVSGVEQLMMCCIAYIPGIACYIWARVEQRQKVFTARERLLAFLLVAIGIFMIGYVAANGIL